MFHITHLHTFLTFYSLYLVVWSVICEVGNLKWESHFTIARCQMWFVKQTWNVNSIFGKMRSRCDPLTRPQAVYGARQMDRTGFGIYQERIEKMASIASSDKCYRDVALPPKFPKKIERTSPLSPLSTSCATHWYAPVALHWQTYSF